MQQSRIVSNHVQFISSLPLSVARTSGANIILFVVQIGFAAVLSLIIPFLFRCFVLVPCVELMEPLEFTFHTCADQMHGVCSFPEAEVLFDERDIKFHKGYAYRFRLNVIITELETIRSMGIFMAQIEIKDEKLQSLMISKKTVRVPPTGWYERFINIRNFFFWPLRFVGFLDDNTVGSLIVDFPSEHQENNVRNARYITIQLQNRFLQITSASLQIRANTGYLSYFIGYYPIITYLVMSFMLMSFFIAILLLHWTKRSYRYILNLKNCNDIPHNSKNKHNDL